MKEACWFTLAWHTEWFPRGWPESAVGLLLWPRPASRDGKQPGRRSGLGQWWAWESLERMPAGFGNCNWQFPKSDFSLKVPVTYRPKWKSHHWLLGGSKRTDSGRENSSQVLLSLPGHSVCRPLNHTPLGLRDEFRAALSKGNVMWATQGFKMF